MGKGCKMVIVALVVLVTFTFAAQAEIQQLSAIVGHVLAAKEKQKLEDKNYEALVNRIEGLEDIIRKQTEVFASERQQWLAEKQFLQISVQRLETLWSPLGVIFPGDGTDNKNEAASQSPKLEKENIDSQTQKRETVASLEHNPLLILYIRTLEKVDEANANFQALNNKVNKVSTDFQDLNNKVNQVSTDVQDLNSKGKKVDITLHTLNNKMIEVSSSVYVHWGSSKCPHSADLVYHGEIGGSSFHHVGAAVNYLCLPLTDLNLFDITDSKYARLYGAEYETGDQHHDKDAVCAVCRSSYPTNMMIPARTVCPSGWTLEYSGWLMAGYVGDSAASEYICVNSTMEKMPGANQDDDGKLLFYTITDCGSLPCAPYVDDKKVACVVCSK